jgi:C-terminal processing protease CtpA/Prc
VYDTVGAPYSSSIKSDHAVLNVPTFSYRKPKSYYAFLKDFFTELSARQLDTLILDLRGNYGGSPAPTAELFKYLIDKPTPFFARNNPIYLAPWKKPVEPAPEAFHGTLYVLVDEAAFSMNSFLISLLRYHGIGTLVGSATAGSWACSDAARGATLKSTGLRLKYSTQAFYTAVEGQEAGIGILPDVPVAWTLADHLEGRDPVLAAALALAGVSPTDPD